MFTCVQLNRLQGSICWSTGMFGSRPSVASSQQQGDSSAVLCDSDDSPQSEENKVKKKRKLNQHTGKEDFTPLGGTAMLLFFVYFYPWLYRSGWTAGSVGTGFGSSGWINRWDNRDKATTPGTRSDTEWDRCCLSLQLRTAENVSSKVRVPSLDTDM